MEPKNGKTGLIFHYIPCNVTIHYIHTEAFINPQSINLGLEHNCSSFDWMYKIPWAKLSCAKPWMGPPNFFIFFQCAAPLHPAQRNNSWV